MKIAVFGTGGIGGIFGSRLNGAGESVHFIARGSHLEAIRDRGLVIETGSETKVYKDISATDDPAAIGPVDVVLFGVKLWDTESAAEACRPLLGEDTAVVSVQNGIDAYRIIARVLGPPHAVAGVAEVSAVISVPGTIRQTGAFCRIRVGEEDGRGSPRLEAFRDACLAADIECFLSDDVEAARWLKFVLFVPVSGLTALTRQSIDAVLGDPDMRATFAACLEEVVAVGRASAVNLAADQVAKTLAVADGLPAGMKASMARDLEEGRRLELDWLSGRIARMGKELSLPTPVNDTIYAALKPYALGA